MNRILDKTFTLSVRQVWRWTRRMIYVVLLVYPVMIFLSAWNIKMGGVTLNRSPFAERVPVFCHNRVGHTHNSNYVPESQSELIDILLLRDRVIESYIDGMISGVDGTVECFGSEILVGLHGEPTGTGNVIHRWVDSKGRPVVTVHLRYHQTLKDIGITNKREDEK